MLKLLNRVFSKPNSNSMSDESRKSILQSIEEHKLVIRSLQICEQDVTNKNEIQKEKRFIEELESKL